MGALGLMAALGLVVVSASSAAAGVLTLTVRATDTLVVPGEAVVITATASNVPSPAYQFWVESPNGRWTDAQNYSSRDSLVLNTTATGVCRVMAYVLPLAELAKSDGRPPSGPERSWRPTHRRSYSPGPQRQPWGWGASAICIWTPRPRCCMAL